MSYDADLQLFIDGVWKSGEGRDTHTVINPATGSGIADVPLATKADLDEALAAADRAWPIWRSTDVEKRGAILAQDRRPAARTGRPYRRDHDAGAGQAARRSRAEVIGSASLFTGTPRRSSATMAARWSARPASCRA